MKTMSVNKALKGRNKSLEDHNGLGLPKNDLSGNDLKIGNKKIDGRPV
jgi:hypothetical protein